MIVFIKLILAHLIGDFILQPNAWVADKEKKKQQSIYLYLHAAVHGIIAWILIGNAMFAGFALLLIVVHGFIDYVKLYFQKSKNKRTWFIIDQIAHIVSLAIIALLYENKGLEFQEFSNGFWVVITAVVFVSKPCSIIIKTIISIWTPENKNTTDDSLANAGNFIGILERLLILCFILTHHFEAIGFLLAAKSIFRFGDLKEAKDRKLTEYVLIGSLLSFGIAICIGLLTELVLQSF
ncbi:DUF3307 domain-containing protein [Flavobacterium agrisoli]|uniref:DUF3307 domain-containing protein n=1 Tax=Flavobacterium agrisoli TaxID=2793066 RepID=A0A934PJ25_9FLAO|nr:DUF3307 domain-containing protein [Flavobacterium agrisoli]MBK0369041.1 DUF3307 domain-containing protein [Flavobacterium agrisoli]